MFLCLVMIVAHVLKIYFSFSECPQSAFQVAVAANQHLIVQDLVNLGAQVNTTDCWGRTPLHVCAEKGHSQVLQVRGGGPGFHHPLSQHLDVRSWMWVACRNNLFWVDLSSLGILIGKYMRSLSLVNRYLFLNFAGNSEGCSDEQSVCGSWGN